MAAKKSTETADFKESKPTTAMPKGLEPFKDVPVIHSDYFIYGSKETPLTEEQYTATNRWMRHLNRTHGFTVSIGSAFSTVDKDGLEFIFTHNNPYYPRITVWLPILLLYAP